ncbi:extracellular solute-binding protein [Cohnella fermenti]|uniref:Extracellular solute-binding protein n=1 Tax=Cohnella fermenti TaxID=2565925 RepID=A0A4S4BG61_9BACL|nr:extracellular solute-binding protein [Cohnella fermenti]THF73406.1 extracellular solute-binding protein [Cohnella fermenti]
MNGTKNASWKKIAASTMALTLSAAALLSACSGNNTANNTGNNSSSSAPASNAATSSASSSAAAPAREVTVMRSDTVIQPWLADSPALQEIMKNTNTKITTQAVPESDYDAKKNTLIATNNLPDVLFVKKADIITYANTGVFLNLTPYLDEYAPNLKKRMESDPEVNKLKVDGDLYGFPIMANKENAANVGNFPMIRTDVLEELNLAAPTTFDELYEVLKAFKQAYPDSYPWSFRNGSEYNLKFLAYAFGGGFPIYYEPKEDKFVYGVSSDGFKEAVTFLNKLYKEKLLDPNFAALTVQQWQQNLSSGKSLFFYDNYTFATNFNAALQETDPDAKFDMLPVLADANGNKRNYMDNPSSFNSYVISSKVQNPEEIIKMFDWMYSDEGLKSTNFGVSGEHYTEDNGTITIAQSLLDQFKDKQDPYRAMQSFLGTGLLSFAVMTDDTPMFASSPEQLKVWSDAVKSQKEAGIVVEKPLDPPFTEEERDQLKQLNSKVGTLVTQNVDKFIMGNRPLSELDQFAQELASSGAADIEKIYNDAWARMK